MRNVKQDIVLVLILILIDVLICFLPTGFKGRAAENSLNSIRAKVKVLDVDNSEVKSIGVVSVGEQVLGIEVLKGRLKGKRLKAVNHLIGKLELDKIFERGDRALAVLNLDNTGKEIIIANVLDHYRINIELILFLSFSAILLLYSGWIGMKSLLSFVTTVIFIWKLLIPGFLKGYDPIILSLLIVSLLAAVIIYLVAGINKKGHVAFLGTFGGIFSTCIFSIIFGKQFRLSGAIKPFSEVLLYNGFGGLDLDKLLFSGVFIATSGAVMDIAMDISASMRELKEKNPEISSGELLRSGLSIGRSVIGTMTTTLLLAYSGAYLSLLMVFVGQGIPIVNILNLSYVSSEILNTLVGSFGLVLVAPLSAIVGSVVYGGVPVHGFRVRKVFSFLK